jgi:L-fuculose-phosphate aldolase
MGALAREAALRDDVARVCRRLWERGLVAGQEGNVSARLSAGRILVTPAGFSKVDVTPDDLVVVSAEGQVISGLHRASSELAVHLRAYARRPDVHAVVHAHPPVATGMALAGVTLPVNALPEIIVLLGPVPLVPYGMPGSNDVADRFEPFWAGHDAFLMANHGALTLGPDMRVAHQRMESLEQAAKIVTTARGLGAIRELSETEVRALAHLRNVLIREPGGSTSDPGPGPMQ